MLPASFYEYYNNALHSAPQKSLGPIVIDDSGILHFSARPFLECDDQGLQRFGLLRGFVSTKPKLEAFLRSLLRDQRLHYAQRGAHNSFKKKHLGRIVTGMFLGRGQAQSEP